MHKRSLNSLKWWNDFSHLNSNNRVMTLTAKFIYVVLNIVLLLNILNSISLEVFNILNSHCKYIGVIFSQLLFIIQLISFKKSIKQNKKYHVEMKKYIVIGCINYYYRPPTLLWYLHFRLKSKKNHDHEKHETAV